MPIPASWAPKLLSVMRIAVALAFMQHGTSKLWMFPKAMGQVNAMTMPLGILELVGGLLLVLGLFTRPVAFILSGQMAVAYWWAHWWMSPDHSPYPMVNGGEGALLYCFVFLYLAAAGGGAWSLDAQRGKA